MSVDMPKDSAPARKTIVEKPQSARASNAADIPIQPSRSAKRTSFADKRIGEILVQNGAMQERDIERVLDFARRKRLFFGEAAVKMRLISSEERALAVAAQFDYPYLRHGECGYAKSLVAAFAPFSHKGEAVRQLCNRMLSRRTDPHHWVVGVASPSDSNASSYAASNVAVTLSQIGYQTLLVDCNLTDGTQHDIFNVHNATGMSSLIVGRSDIDSAVLRLPAFRGLSLLPSGGTPPNAADLLSRSECQEAMSQLRQRYDIVIVNVPSTMETGAEAVTRFCDSALLVVRRNRTQISDAQATIAAIRASGADIIGSALLV